MIFKLLVVDDESIMRKGIANFIDWDSLDCKVAGTAGNGVEAIEFIKTNPVDIVITDIKMPGADGLAVAKFIYENKPEIKVILLTGYADFEMTGSAYLPSFQERLSALGISLEHYYIAAFQLVPLENDIAFLKNIIINEKRMPTATAIIISS